MNQKELLIISITIFCTIIAWIVADIYHITTSGQNIVQDEKYMQPIRVDLDMELFEDLKMRDSI